MGSILVIVYHYPPLQSVTSIRNSKLVKYLKRMNWDIHVLTVKLEIIEGIDRSLERGLPKDVRTSRVDSYSRYIVQLENKGGFPKLWWWLPDRRFLWIGNSIRTGSKIIKREEIDVILSSSPPYSAAVLGSCLSKLHGIPHIIDFHDPWTQNFYLPEYPTRLHKWLNEFLEHRVSTDSAGLIFNSPGLKRIFMEKYREIPEDKCYVLRNGFDPEDFLDIKPSKPEKFTISCIGVLYDPEPFFKNLSHLLENGNIMKKEICLQLTPQSSDIIDLISKYKLDDVTSLIKRVPYLESLQLLVNSHVLLLTLPKDVPYIEYVPSSKIYHYMATGNPILAIVPPGEALDLTQNYGNGIAINPSDDQAIQDGIMDFYLKFKKDELKTMSKSDIPQKYTYDRLASELNRILEECCRPLNQRNSEITKI